MEIPYNVSLREDTGLYNSKLGIWLFLASEVMLFGGLFSAYILLRTGAPVWPPIGADGHSVLHILKETVPHATFNTVILILSSVTMVMAWVSLKQKNLSKYKKIIPCGIKNKEITSLKDMKIKNYKNIEEIIIKKFLNIFL